MDYEMLKARANLDDAIHVITSEPPPSGSSASCTPPISSSASKLHKPNKLNTLWVTESPSDRVWTPLLGRLDLLGCDGVAALGFVRDAAPHRARG